MLGFRLSQTEVWEKYTSGTHRRNMRTTLRQRAGSTSGVETPRYLLLPPPPQQRPPPRRTPPHHLLFWFVFHSTDSTYGFAAIKAYKIQPFAKYDEHADVSEANCCPLLFIQLLLNTMFINFFTNTILIIQFLWRQYAN